MIWRTICHNIKSNLYEHSVYCFAFAMSVTFIYAYAILADSKLWLDMGFSVGFSVLSNKIIFAFPFVLAIPTVLLIYVEHFLYMRKKKELAVRILLGFARQKVAGIYCLEKMIIALVGGIIGILMGVLFAPLMLFKTVAYMEEAFSYRPLFSINVMLGTWGYVIFILLLFSIYYYRRINKDVLVDMLKANENQIQTPKKQQVIWKAAYVIFAAFGIYMSFLLYLYFPTYLLWNKVLGAISAILPLGAIGICVCTKNNYKKRTFSIVFGAFEEMIVCLQFSVLYSMYRANIVSIHLLYFLVFGMLVLVFYIIIGFYEVLSDMLMEKRLSMKRCSQRRIVLGELCYHAKIYGKIMAAITITMIFLLCLEILIPIFVNRLEGYLHARSVYDMQVFSVASYSKYLNKEDSIRIDYEKVSDKLKEKGIIVNSEVRVEMFFVDEYMENGEKRMATCISLSDYNEMLVSLGIEPVSMEGNYIRQWAKDYSQEQMDDILKGITKIKVGESEWSNTEAVNYKHKVGMALSVGHMEYVYIVQDNDCKNLLRATSFGLYQFETILSYEECTELEKEIDVLHKEYEEKMNKVYVRLKRLQRADTMSVIAVIKIAFEYVGGVLLLCDLAILSVQLLIGIMQSGKSYFIMHSLGFSKSKVKLLTFENELVWFLIPMIISTIVALGCIVFFFAFFLEEFLFYNTWTQIVLLVIEAFGKLIIFSSLYILVTWLISRRIIVSNTFQQELLIGERYSRR